MMKNEVFDRTDYNSHGQRISGNVYNLIIGLVLCYGFLVNWWMVRNVPLSVITGIHPIIFFIGYFACCFTGIMIFKKSHSPHISFLGYNLVVVPFGFVINIVVAQYDSALVVDAIQVTGLVTLTMMLFGTLFPAFFQKIAGALSIALIAVIIAELILIFFFKTNPEIIDWIVVVIFCGYIGYDWGRANSIPKTVDNAIDSAAALYMDIIILFVRILRIMGRRR
jgi:FtsH-binding integral membrane protein